MAIAPLPPALEARLAALADRVRRLRVARGVCWLVVALLGSAAALVLLDYTFSLSAAGRCLLQVVWLGLSGFLTWYWVVRPWRAQVPLDELARRVEHQFPGLGERLVTVVGLRDQAGQANGSPNLIATLARDTERRTQELDFTRAAPARPVARLGLAAGLVVLAAAAGVAAVPGSGERLRRVGMPWYRPTVIVPFRVIVSSGDPVVQRGAPVTLSAYVERTGPAAALPDAAVLVFRDGSDPSERKLPMTGDGSGAFHVTRPRVGEDFEYRVEAGPAASEWHTVTVADPVELTPESTAEIVPPGYAAGTIRVRATTGLAELEGFQHATARLQLHFNRPATIAYLDWRTADGVVEVIPIALAADRTSGTAVVRLRHNGTLQVVLQNEDGPRRMRTVTPVPVHVTPDAPPRFEQVSGVPGQPRAVRPGDRVLVNITVSDDVGIGTAVLEYAVGPKYAQAPPIPIVLTGAGSRLAEGRVVLDLLGKGTTGSVVRFRVRVTDNRQLVDPRLGPQEAVYPPAGWAELRLSDSAPPLEQQEIFGQRDALGDALRAAIREVKEAKHEATTLRPDTASRSPLPVDHAVRVDTSLKLTAKAADRLRGAAREASLTTELRPLATATRDVADSPLAEADAALRRAVTDNPADRVAALSLAVKHLAEAAARTEDLLDRNTRVAQDRLDRRRLDVLSVDQMGLAASPASPDELARTQAELLVRLNRMTAESDPLARAAAAGFAREVQALAAAARDLGAAVRGLGRASEEVRGEVRRNLLDRLAAEVEPDDRAAAVLARAELAARVARLTPPRAESFRRAADLITQGRLIEAQVELEKVSQSLEATARAFEEWATQRNDSKRAAEQLARWQEDLRERFTAMTQDTPFAKLPDNAKAAFRTEQRVIRNTAERLRLPPVPAVADAGITALTALRKATDNVNGDGSTAASAMKAAEDALIRLASVTPTVAERIAAARTELDAIRRDQESATVAAEKVTRTADRDPLDAAGLRAIAGKLAEAREKQRKLIPRLAALDLPGHEPRQARAVAAFRLALADMEAGLPFDTTASLARCRRELVRLKQAVDHMTPVDVLAAKLADEQARIARDLATLGDSTDIKRLRALASAQLQVGRQLTPLLAPETPVLLNNAREAVKAAEIGYRDGSKPVELRRRADTAAAALAKLADRLAGAESDTDRVKRIAGSRRLAAITALAMVGTASNPATALAASQQLGHEVEELIHSRVGAAGQSLKKAVLDLYARCRARPDPDRHPEAHAELAAALDRLAAAMANIPELASAPSRDLGPGPPAEADAFLPSASLADALRELARDQRAVRERTNEIDPDVARWTKPAEVNTLGPVIRKQWEVAAAAGTLARALTVEKDPTAADAATRAADAAVAAADRLTLGQLRSGKEAGELAARRLRELSVSGGRAWSKSAGQLAAQQESLLATLSGFLNNPAVATAQQAALSEELGTKAADLAGRLERAAMTAMPGDDAGQTLAEAAGLARHAGKMLTEAAYKARDGMAAEAQKLQADAEMMLRQAMGNTTAAADSLPARSPDPSTTTLGDALRQARNAMQDATQLLGPAGSQAAAREAMNQAAEALHRAAQSVGASHTPPLEGSLQPEPRPNGNTDTTPAPANTDRK